MQTAKDNPEIGLEPIEEAQPRTLLHARSQNGVSSSRQQRSIVSIYLARLPMLKAGMRKALAAMHPSGGNVAEESQS